MKEEEHIEIVCKILRNLGFTITDYPYELSCQFAKPIVDIIAESSLGEKIAVECGKLKIDEKYPTPTDRVIGIMKKYNVKEVWHIPYPEFIKELPIWRVFIFKVTEVKL